MAKGSTARKRARKLKAQKRAQNPTENKNRNIVQKELLESGKHSGAHVDKKQQSRKYQARKKPSSTEGFFNMVKLTQLAKHQISYLLSS